MTRGRISAGHLAFALALALVARRSDAQGPRIEPPDATRVPESTSLGRVPGSGGTRGGAPADLGTILGGRPGPSVPRVPTEISTPGQGFALPPGRGVAVPPSAPFTELPVYGPLALPGGADRFRRRAPRRRAWRLPGPPGTASPRGECR